MMRYFLSILCSLFCIVTLTQGCGAYPNRSDVYVAPDVPTNYLMAGMQMWTEAVDVEFFIIDEDTTCDGKGDGCISIHMEKLADMRTPANPLRIGYTFCPVHAGDCNIYIGSDIDAENSTGFTWEKDGPALFGHEIGHGLGLVHHSGHYLMNPTLSALKPQCDDIQQYYDLRDMGTAPCMTELPDGGE